MTRPEDESAEVVHASGEQAVKLVPAEFEVRRSIRGECVRTAAGLSRERALDRERLEALGRSVLARTGQDEAYLGFAMVELNNAFWREQFAEVPFRNRLLLLPHCLRDAEACRGSYGSRGLECADCGACRISGLKRQAEGLGYSVIVAEGTPEVLKTLLVGHADALLGVACLDSLEKAYDLVSGLGIPNAAVPLLRDGCVNTEVEYDRIESWLTLESAGYSGVVERTASYVPLLRLARELFEPGVLEGLLSPEVSSQPRLSDPLTGTEAIALDWLRAGGKRFRPFVTLAAYAGRKLGRSAFVRGAGDDGMFGEALKRAAVAVEIFHKASLVHDDIEDDDIWRYGGRTVHQRYGTPVAVNVGDYLLGLGYRLLASCKDELGGECAADILGSLTRAHVALSRGQGAELLRRLSTGEVLEPLEVLTTYALKTAPAFEAAITVGLRIAGAIEDETARAVRTYSRHLGVAYQVLNDLEDFEEGRHPLRVGGDVRARRPTVLLAFMLKGSDESSRRQVWDLLDSEVEASEKVRELGRLYSERGVFAKARALVGKYRQRAHAVADGVDSAALGDLLHFITDTVLR